MSSRSSQETFSLGRVIEAPLHDLVRSRFLNYALSVITDRALPDVRDGLKPVQRRILYAMHHDLHLSPDKSTLKCAKVVGQVLGSYHPHGDSAVYEAMARMAQPWTLRYPLVFGQGNFGSIDGDGPAAYRYTEARLSPIAMEFVEELGQNTVDFVPNFDESTPEPKVLPAKVPQMLINGCMGIAVGVATNIPPHNLGEVLQACCALIDNRQLGIAQLLTYIEGPDFPTGGELLNSCQSLEQIYGSGQGALKIRGTYKIEEKNKRLFNIIIDSIPYMVNKSELVEEIGSIIIAGKIPHLQDVRDESAADIRIVLECRREADPTSVMAYLFKNTKLQNQFNVNMTCLTSRGPERVNLRTALLDFIDFRFEVTVRRLNYEVRLLNERIHILEGFVKVFDAIEEAIAIIRASSGRAQANQALCERFLVDEVQADAVLDLRLYRLSQDDVLLIRDELADKQAKRDHLEALLEDMPALWSLVKDEFVLLRQRLADSRRTQVLREGAEELVYNADDFILEEKSEVVITRDGWLRRVPIGTDVSKLRLRMEDSVWQILDGSSLNSLVLFTNFGTAYTMAVHELPGGARGFGEPVQKFFNFSDGEKIIAAFLFDSRSSEVWSAQEDHELPSMHALALSSDGKGVRFSFAPFVESSKKSGRRYMRLGDGVQALMVEAVRGTEHLIVLTEQNRALICPIGEIGFMSGCARGVQVIKLENEDKLWESMTVSSSDQGIMLSRSGSGTPVEVSMRKQKVCARGGKGTLLIKRGKLQMQQKFYSAAAVKTDLSEAETAPTEGSESKLSLGSEA
ncbi:MAG: DNA topoisomerase (ATP-hydrolyzing) subunit A [Candidatus Bruticola sp.]